MSLSKLTETIEEVLKQKRAHFNVAVYERDSPDVFSSLIDRRWNIEIVAHSNLEQILQGIVEKEGLQRMFPDPVKTLAYTAIVHEGGHWEHCPYDISQCEEILHGVHQELKQSLPKVYQGLAQRLHGVYAEFAERFSQARKSERTFMPSQDVFADQVVERNLQLSIGRAANLFDDFVDDTVNSVRDTNAEEYVKGLGLRLLLFKEMDGSVFGRRHYSKMITFYADMLARLTGMPQEIKERLAASYHPEMPELEVSVRNALTVLLGDEKLAGKVYAGKLLQAEREDVAARLSDKASWGGKAKQLAAVAVPYLAEEPEESAKALCNYLLVALGLIKPGTGLGQSIATQQSITSRMPVGIEGEEGEEGELSGDPDVKQQIISVGIGKGHEVGYISRFELLDTLYRERAEDILVQVISKKKADQLLGPRGSSVVAYLDRERVSGDFDIARIDWPRTLIIGRGGKEEVVLFQKDLPLLDSDPFERKGGEIPDLAFIVDSSGSMGADLVRGYGPYDLLLRSIYSIFRMLEKNRKGYQMRYSVVNFSGRTVFSGWHPVQELDKVKRALLRYQGSGTTLDTATIDKLVSERKDRFLAFLVTDSMIWNVDEVEHALDRLVDAGNYLVQFHIGHRWGFELGQHKPLYARLAAKGLPVHVLSDPADLVGLSVEWAEKFYGELK